MKRITLILSLAIIPFIWTNCQKIGIAGSIGYGHSNMHDLKMIQEMKLAELDLPAKITDDFPWTINYSIELQLELENFTAGFSYFFLTTGSRISYSDYSGEINLDLTAINNCAGPSIMYHVFKHNKMRIGPRIQLPILFSRITEKNYLRIYDESDTEINRLYSLSFAFFPSLDVSYRLSRLNLGLRLGYLIDIHGRLVREREMTIYLVNSNYYTTNWSGPQINFILGYQLFGKN